MGIWWDLDNCFYYATVLAYNDSDGKCEVLYDDDGVREWLDFSKVRIDWGKSDAQEVGQSSGSTLNLVRAISMEDKKFIAELCSNVEVKGYPLSDPTVRELPSGKRRRQAGVDIGEMSFKDIRDLAKRENEKLKMVKPKEHALLDDDTDDEIVEDKDKSNRCPCHQNSLASEKANCGSARVLYSI